MSNPESFTCFCSAVKPIAELLSLVITVVGFVLAYYLYMKGKGEKTRRKMAKEIIAYHTEERLLVSEVRRLRLCIEALKGSFPGQVSSIQASLNSNPSQLTGNQKLLLGALTNGQQCSSRTIMKQFRKESAKTNIRGYYPSMTANEANKYIK